MSFDSSHDFLITTCFWWLSVYYKGTKQILVLQKVQSQVEQLKRKEKKKLSSVHVSALKGYALDYGHKLYAWKKKKLGLAGP